MHCSLVVFERFPSASPSSALAAADVEVLTRVAVQWCLATLVEQRRCSLVVHLVKVESRDQVSAPYCQIVGGWHLGLEDEGEALGKPCPFDR